MFHYRYALVSFLIVLTASCASVPTEKPERFTINSREWINPSFRDIHANVAVERISPQVYSLKYAFSVPLDPTSGVSPTDFHFFTFCLASKLSKQHNFSHWSIGALDKNIKYRNTTALELFVAVLNDKDALPTEAQGKSIQWLQTPNASDGFHDSCTKIFRPQFMWTKRGGQS